MLYHSCISLTQQATTKNNTRTNRRGGLHGPFKATQPHGRQNEIDATPPNRTEETRKPPPPRRVHK